MTFANDLKAFEAKVRSQANATVREMILGFTASIVQRSPVGDPGLWSNRNQAIAAYAHGYKGGNFKANWQGGDGHINTLITEDIDPTGEISMANIMSAIPDAPSGKVFYISNSLPYAGRLEDGHSSQAPLGIVGLAILEYQTIVSEAVIKVKI